MLPNWQRWAVVGALIVVVLNAYLVGRRSATQDIRDAESKKAIKAHSDSTKYITLRLDSAKVVTAKLDSTHDIIRTKIRVVHDTIETPTQVVVDSTLAEYVENSEAVIEALHKEIALRDTLIASLRKDVVLRDSRIKLLEQTKESRTGKILAATRYIAIGAVLGAAFLHR